VSTSGTAGSKAGAGRRASGDHPGKLLQRSLCPFAVGCAAHAGGALRSSRKIASDSLARITSLQPARQHPCAADTDGPDCAAGTKVGKRGVEQIGQTKNPRKPRHDKAHRLARYFSRSSSPGSFPYPCRGADLDDRQMEAQTHADSAKDADGLQLPSKPVFRSAQVSMTPSLHALAR